MRYIDFLNNQIDINSKDINILVVDDEKEFCKDIKLVLEEISDNINVSLAFSGDQAIDIIKKNNDLHVIVTDIRMPVMDGLELIEKASLINNNLQFIVITGHGDINNAVQAMKLGALNFIQKPINIHFLHGEIISAWEKYQFIAKLLENEEKFNCLVESSHDGIVMVDNLNKIVFWNNAATRIFGISSKQALGKIFYKTIIPEDLKSFHSDIIKKKEGVKIRRSLEASVQNSDKKNIPVELSISNVKINKKNYYIAIIRDVTERKKRVEKIKKLNIELKDKIFQLELANKNAIKMADEAKNANNAKNQFLANISHEIRTPMNSILGFSELLIDTDLNLTQKDYLKSIINSSESLLSLINDILDLSKIEAQKLDLLPQNFNLMNIMEKIKSIFEIKIKEKNLEFNIVIDDEVPVQLYGDKNRLLQILINLVNNAIKFTKYGKIDIHIKIEKQIFNNILMYFSVTDTGIGIAEEDQSRLFKPFSQIHNSDTSAVFEGTGLGLAISKKIVELMNGKISLISEKGKGSKFWFIVQLEKNKHDKIKTDNIITIDENSKSSINSQIKDISILIVDDSHLNCRLVKELLMKASIKSYAVNNGREAVELLKKEKFDLILMDIQMPVLDGIRTTEIIRNPDSDVLDHNVPIIAVTANAMDGDRNKCIEVGMNNYISKPFKYKKLIEIVEITLLKNKSKLYTNSNNSNDIDENGNQTSLLNLKDACSNLGNDKELWKMLADSFINEIPNRIKRLYDLLKNKKTKETMIEAHTIKSSSAIVGAHAMQKIAFEMELNSSKMEGEYLLNLLHKLDNLYKKTEKELLKIIQI